jgi:hypothetical protein
MYYFDTLMVKPTTKASYRLEQALHPHMRHGQGETITYRSHGTLAGTKHCGPNISCSTTLQAPSTVGVQALVL